MARIRLLPCVGRMFELLEFIAESNISVIETNQQILTTLEQHMGQTEDLRAAIAQVGTDLGEAVARVEAKITALGEPDADLSADIAALKDFGTQLDGLAADAPADPADPPVDPPVDPPADPPADPPVA